MEFEAAMVSTIVDGDFAARCFNPCFDDRESETGAAALSRATDVNAVEAFE